MWSKQYLIFHNCPKCIWKFSFTPSFPPISCFRQRKFKDILDPVDTLNHHDWASVNSIPSNMFSKYSTCQSHCIIERQIRSVSLPLQPSQLLSLSMTSLPECPKLCLRYWKTVLPQKNSHSSRPHGAYKHAYYHNSLGIH